MRASASRPCGRAEFGNNLIQAGGHMPGGVKTDVRTYQLYINGEWVNSQSNKTFPVYDPASEEVIAQAPEANADDVNRAVAAAKAAFEDGPWATTTAQERGRVLFRLADKIRQNTTTLAELESRNTGKPIVEAEYDINVVDVVFRFDDWLASVAGFEFGQRGCVLANLVGEAKEHTAAFLSGSGCPRTILKGGFRGSDGAVHVVRVCLGGLCDYFFAGGIVDGKSLVRLAINPLAIDVELISSYIGFYSTRHVTPCLNQIIAELRSAARARRRRPHRSLCLAICGGHTHRRKMRPAR